MGFRVKNAGPNPGPVYGLSSCVNMGFSPIYKIRLSVLLSEGGSEDQLAKYVSSPRTIKH